MPTLNEVLQSDITREIEGVVKADDAARIDEEIREYVITRQIEKGLRRLFEGYADALRRRAEKGGDTYPYNGVWISGYFGSGKSHLLKILSYLMSDNAKPEWREMFLSTIEDEFLRADVEAAFRNPSLSVLFNIDQQADAEADDQSQVILLVFERVFNRQLGYCDNDPVIADFERDIDMRGEYAAFKEAFLRETGRSWEDLREAVFGIERDSFARAWASFKNVDESRGWDLLDQYERSRSLTTDKFANRVKAWLDARSDPAYRVNFFIDEVGQFVANRRDRMLNLQTVAETLATVCENRAWVFVTSQEDLDTVIGDATQQQREDFSRITARFYFRLPLTSTNVEEVIQKRLLAKTPEGERVLSSYYEENAEQLRTVYQFGKGVKDLRFTDTDGFVLSYPFLAYQFHYLQESLKGLSDHNAFIGRHVSRGERSMLEVFQDVGKQLADTEIVKFATFDQMFDGIRNTLRGGILSQIDVADSNLSNRLAVRIMKVLLMLKYVKNFPTTVEHITTLLIESLERDRSKLREKVQDALDTLAYQSYIQRDGDEYVYLTDQEKDVEVEIKQTNFEYTEARRFIGSVVVEKILKTNRITYEANDQPYTFSVYVDGEHYRRGAPPLAMRIITHLHPNAGDKQTILNQSMGTKELIVMLNVDARVDDDLRLYHQTKTYLNHIGHSDDPQHDRILTDKRTQNSARERRLREDLLPALIESAELYVADRPVQTTVRDPKERLVAGFQDLISTSFPNLRLLSGKYTEDALRQILFPRDGYLPYDAMGLGEDEAEMQALLQRRQQAATHTSVANLKDELSGGQYGWYEWAVLGVLAKLYVRGVVELVEGSGVLEVREVHDRLSKGHGHEQVTVRLAQPLDTQDQNRLASFYQEFFHEPATASGSKELLIAFKQKLLELRDRLRNLAAQSVQYPFLEPLKGAAQKYEALANKEYRALAETLLEDEEELLREKLEFVDQALNFIEGSGRDTYERIRLYLQTNRDNFSALGLSDALAKLDAYLASAEPWAKNATKHAREIYDDASSKISTNLTEARAQARKAIDDAVSDLKEGTSFPKLSEEAQVEVLRPFTDELPRRVLETNNIDGLENMVHVTVPQKMQRCRESIEQRARPEEKISYATKRETRVMFDKAELTTVEDVDEYAEELRRQYRELIEQGKRISL